MKDRNAIIQATQSYLDESEVAKRWRIDLNRENYEMYHGHQDMSHKLKGQSKEFLPRQAMGVEQTAQFLHQGLVEFGDFFSANIQPGLVEKRDTLFSSNEVRELIKWQLKKADFYNFALDAIKSGILGSLIIIKVGGKMVPKRRFITEKDGDSEKLLRDKSKTPQLSLSLPRQSNYHIDPESKGLFKIEEVEMDAWELEMMGKMYPKMFDRKELKKAIELAAGGGDKGDQSDADKESERNQPNGPDAYRRKIQIRECYGNIIDPTTGKLLYENKMWMVADGKYVIMKPRDITSWDQRDPYVESALIRTPNSAWHKALADFPTMLNKTLNEAFNLIIDSGLQSVFGIKQVREAWLEDPSEIEEGITPGMTLGVNAACPPGQKVLERVDSNSAGASEAMNAFNLISAEHNLAMMQNDVRTGQLPQRAVKATEIVASENSITNVMTGVAKSLENSGIAPTLDKIWTWILQNFKKFDPVEVKAILGEKRYEELYKLSEKEIFAKSYGGFFFKVYGITQTMNKIKDFKKLTGFLQATGSNPQLNEAFVRKYSFTKLLGEIVKALDINEDRILHDKADLALNELEPEQMGGVNPMNQMDGQMTQFANPGTGNLELEAGGGEAFRQFEA